MSISLSTDRQRISAHGPTQRHLLVEVTAPPVPPRDAAMPRPPVAISLVLDRSGSMSGEKIELVREAAKQAVRSLSPADQCAVVVYDNEVTCLSPLHAVTTQHKARLLELLDTVHDRGSTNLSGGWFSGVDQLRMEVPVGVRRCLLLTDGLANAGMTDPDRLAACAEQFRGQGIVTSTFGVGADFDEHLLRNIARNGGGNFYFIEHAAQIPELLVSEVGDALDVVMPQAVLEVHVPMSVTVRAVDGRAVTPMATGWQCSIGDLVDQQVVRLVLSLEFAAGPLGEQLSADVRVIARNGMTLGALQPVVWRRMIDSDVEAEPRDLPTDRATALAYAGKARVAATLRNREGDLAGAGQVLMRTAKRIAAYAGEDPELRALVHQLRMEAEEFREERLSPTELKSRMFAAHAVAESRDMMGRPVRRRRS